MSLRVRQDGAGELRVLGDGLRERGDWERWHELLSSAEGHRSRRREQAMFGGTTKQSAAPKHLRGTFCSSCEKVGWLICRQNARALFITRRRTRRPPHFRNFPVREFEGRGNNSTQKNGINLKKETTGNFFPVYCFSPFVHHF